MAINGNDIKLFQAQDNTDNDSGGGSRTANEVTDGEVNNLFPDISRIDTVSGDVALRKVFPTVFTQNQDVYYGAHMMLRKIPSDDKVSSVLFHTDDPHDRRTDAQNKIESYVSGSYREQFYLYGSHIEGATAVTFLQRLESQLPEVGNVYLLREGANEQYIRLTEINDLEVTLTYNDTSYVRRRIICIIDQPLNYAFTGSEFHPSGQQDNTCDTFATQVGAESQFYGTKTLKDPLSVDDTSLIVDSIFEQLVPATKQVTPLVNQDALSQGENLVPTGNIRNVYYDYGYPILTSGTVIQLPDAITPSSITRIYSTVSDDGLGTLLDAVGDPIGTIDYKAGTILYQGQNISGSVHIQYEAANVFSAEIQYTLDILVDLSNQAPTYVQVLNPIPSVNDCYVDYRAQGKWYRIFVNSSDTSLGSVTVEDNGDGTGTAVISLANVPDLDSRVLISWGSNERLTERQGYIAAETQAYMEIDLGQTNIDLSTFTWQFYSTAYATMVTATCDANGNLVENTYNSVAGKVDPITGKVYVVSIGNSDSFESVPTSNDTVINFDYAIPSAGEAGEVIDIHRLPTGDQIGVVSENTSSGIINFDAGKTINVANVRVSIDTELLHSRRFGGSTTFPYQRLDLISDSSGVLRKVGQVSSDTTNYGSVNADGTISVQTLFTDAKDAVSASGGYWVVSSYPRLDDDDSRVIGSITVTTATPATYTESHNITGRMEQLATYKINTVPNIIGEVGFKFLSNSTGGDYNLFSKSGNVYADASTTGIGNQVGTIDYVNGHIQLSYYHDPNDLYIEFTKLFTDELGDGDSVVRTSFRTASSKLTTSSFILSYETASSDLELAYSDNNGKLWASVADGVGSGLPVGIDQDNSNVDTLTGVVSVVFTDDVIPSSIKYNAIAETTLPLDPELLGLDPVRLPADGRVPVFAAGRHLVIFHEEATPTTNATPVANDVETLARSGQSYIEVLDADGKRLNPTQYVADKDAGTVTFADPLVLQDKYNNPLTPPFSVVDRIENMLLATSVEVNGLIRLSGAISYPFPANETKVASALVWGDIGARTYNLFSQETWNAGNPVWSDERDGDPTTAQYDTINNPIQIDNESSTSGRWAIIFTGGTTVRVAEEKLGIVDDNISISIDDVAPINPATGNPYFVMPKEGFGTGWVTNNVIRFNTDSGDANVWVARTVQSGALSEATDSIDIEVRGDAN